MSIGSAYVTGLGVFLPNDAVDNEHIESVIGKVNKFSERVKRRVLINNGIKSRHYAIDPTTGAQTHTNAQMTATAIRNLCNETGFSLETLQCLACGTSSADQVIPHHGSMVHAELGFPACEVTATTGVCCSGLTAFKYGYMSVLSGLSENAITTGSELASTTLRSEKFSSELDLKRADLDREPMLAFENDFLRWMLSDAAAAVLITNQPRSDGLSLRIDWLDLYSYAHESETCMYYGMKKLEDGGTRFYRSIYDYDELCRDGYLSLAQDVKVLQENLPVMMRKAIMQVQRKRRLQATEIDWLLPHYSSDYFRQPLQDGLIELGLEIPVERWFTNLAYKGNTGSASIFVILEELLQSGRAQPGQRILCMVPESARMSFGFLHLTVVAPGATETP